MAVTIPFLCPFTKELMYVLSSADVGFTLAIEGSHCSHLLGNNWRLGGIVSIYGRYL